MGTEILKNCGVFAIPQLLISTVTVALLAGYLVALRRNELKPGHKPWDCTLEPLAGIATAMGLLGSVVGFIVAFSGFQSAGHVDQLTRGLAGAYWTTGVGIVTSLVASGGAYVLSMANREELNRGR